MSSTCKYKSMPTKSCAPKYYVSGPASKVEMAFEVRKGQFLLKSSSAKMPITTQNWIRVYYRKTTILVTKASPILKNRQIWKKWLVQMIAFWIRFPEQFQSCRSCFVDAYGRSREVSSLFSWKVWWVLREKAFVKGKKKAVAAASSTSLDGRPFTAARLPFSQVLAERLTFVFGSWRSPEGFHRGFPPLPA